MPSNHLILCPPLLLLSSIFPSIRVFSNLFVISLIILDTLCYTIAKYIPFKISQLFSSLLLAYGNTVEFGTLSLYLVTLRNFLIIPMVSIYISFCRMIFLTHGSNPGLLHCRQILYHLSHQKSWLCINYFSLTACKMIYLLIRTVCFFSFSFLHLILLFLPYWTGLHLKIMQWNDQKQHVSLDHTGKI